MFRDAQRDAVRKGLYSERSPVTEDFLPALAEDFQRHGTDAIRRCREHAPTEYVAAIASLAAIVAVKALVAQGTGELN